MNLSPGAVFDGLEILGLCGGGAYGDVWLCRDKAQRKLALKVVWKKRIGGDWARELKGVTDYCAITATSPHLLRILHVGEDEECFYYTMEAADSADPDRYVPDTLANRLQNGGLPPERLHPVLREIFECIKTIHEAGCAHRDIKPDNIIFVGGRPKLGDIGLVSSLSNSMTKPAGTEGFLPPELRSSPDLLYSNDPALRRSWDLYAFGMVVYCAVTGMEPRKYPSLPEKVKLSPELKLFWQLARKLCDNNPKRRIRDVNALDREFEDIRRRLENGETRADKIKDALNHLHRQLREKSAALGKTLLKFWWIPMAIALIGPVTWKFWPEPNHRKYVIKSLRLEMRIPKSWQPYPDDYIRDQKKKKDAVNLRGMIACGLADAWIRVSHVDLPAAKTRRLLTVTGEKELRRELRTLGLDKTLQSRKVIFHEIRSVKLAGKPGIAVRFTPSDDTTGFRFIIARLSDKLDDFTEGLKKRTGSVAYEIGDYVLGFDKGIATGCVIIPQTDKLDTVLQGLRIFIGSTAYMIGDAAKGGEKIPVCPAKPDASYAEKKPDASPDVVPQAKRPDTAASTREENNRIQEYMLVDDDGVTIIALMAKEEDFPELLKQFDAALETLVFTAP